jgi:HAD superfamily hydrolase (TIGR01458 family)
MSLEGIRGLLIDIDGTLLVDDQPVPGAAQAVSALRERGLALRFSTNTTRRPRAATASVLSRSGIEAGPGEVVAPVMLARRRILASGRLRAGLIVPPEAREDLAGVVEDERTPDWVVIGDVGRGFTWERLNAAFRWLRGGASLLALHKNRWWLAGEDGAILDAGAFVTALEYACEVTAEVVGKPSPAFYELALEEVGLVASEALVIGDDPETDVEGGARVGCRTALVRTGKFTGRVEDLPVRPDLVLDSIADLPEVLGA